MTNGNTPAVNVTFHGKSVIAMTQTEFRLDDALRDLGFYARLLAPVSSGPGWLEYYGDVEIWPIGAKWAEYGLDWVLNEIRVQSHGNDFGANSVEIAEHGRRSFAFEIREVSESTRQWRLNGLDMHHIFDLVKTLKEEGCNNRTLTVFVRIGVSYIVGYDTNSWNWQYRTEFSHPVPVSFTFQPPFTDAPGPQDTFVGTHHDPEEGNT